MCQDISSNLVAHAAPAEKIGLQVQLLGRTNAAVKRNPAHDLGVHEVTWVAAHLPDATVRFPPVNIAKIAKGFGCAAAKVRQVSDLSTVKEWLDGPRDSPMLIDAKITSERGSWWLEEAFRGH